MGSYYLIIIVISLASMWVSNRLKSKFKKYSALSLRNGMSGKEIAEKMLSDHGIRDVEVISVRGSLTDHYNPKNKTVNLSESVYSQRNAAAAAVAVAGPAAEAGPAAAEQTEFDVVLESAGAGKLKVVKEVKTLLGIGLKEAKEMVDGAPATLKSGVSKEEAESIKAALKLA